MDAAGVDRQRPASTSRDTTSRGPLEHIEAMHLGAVVSHRAIAAASGFRAVLSMPLTDRGGHDSAFARLRAKMETMPVIEQAKGIVMAQRGCGPEEAFDVLREMSQHANVKLHALAEQMVGQIAAGQKDNVAAGKKEQAIGAGGTGARPRR